MHAKIFPHTLIFVFIVLFCVDPVHIRPFAPICIHREPYVPIHTPLYRSRLNMSFWGNFPGHRAKYVSYMLIFVSSCRVFVFPRVPMTRSTHIHPCALISIYFHPSKPEIIMYACIIYVNLIEK